MLLLLLLLHEDDDWKRCEATMVRRVLVFLARPMRGEAARFTAENVASMVCVVRCWRSKRRRKSFPFCLDLSHTPQQPDRFCLTAFFLICFVRAPQGRRGCLGHVTSPEGARNL